MSEEEEKDGLEMLEELAQDMEKSVEQMKLHDKAKVRATAPMLELKIPVGTLMEIKDIPMEVVKVDGMTVTLKRKDIAG